MKKNIPERSVFESLKETPDKLIDILVRQAQLIEHLQHKIVKLEGKLEQRRGYGGGAAPFRVPEEKRQQKCKRPGSKKGHEGN